jgi:acyl-coenzyme A synthetase/AMP-(fatty) acid ligase
VLYTSGTTGNPKGVVRDNAGHLVAIKNSMEMIYDLKPGEVFWAARYCVRTEPYTHSPLTFMRAVCVVQ